MIRRLAGVLKYGLLTLLVTGMTGWGALAIYYSDLPGEPLRMALSAVFGAGTLGAFLVFRNRRRTLILFLIVFAFLVGWWISIPPRNDRDWLRAYILIFVMFPAVFVREFMALCKSYRRETFLALLGMVIFAFGGFGAEIIKYKILQPFFWIFFRNHPFFILFLERTRVAFEEFAEALGETVIVFAVLLFVAKRLQQQAPVNLEKGCHEQTD